ncbi:hypothetical protein [Streptomyces sp. NPDC059015]|uniref:hypothetical protein n=1 Tax=unclassified Streptomyces TaxID=2593676 RepID=UPI0036B7E401
MAPLVRVTRSLAIGAALTICLAGCTRNTAPTTPTQQPESRQFTPLAKIEAISISDDPLQGMGESIDDSPTYLAEVRAASQRLLLYVNSDGCGFVSTSDTKPQVIGINLISKWPEESQNAKTSIGGYNSASASGADNSWVQVKCNKRAMVVEYTHHSSVTVESHRGNISVTEPTKQHPSLLLVVGEPRVRKSASEWQGL